MKCVSEICHPKQYLSLFYKVGNINCKTAEINQYCVENGIFAQSPSFCTA